MKRKNVIEALNKISEGIEMLKTSLGEETVATVEERIEEKSKGNSKFSKEQLESMKYQELKKLAKELEISGAGTRAELIKSIMELPVNVAVVEKNEEDPAMNPPEEVKKDEKIIPLKKKKVEKVAKEPDVDQKFIDMAKSATEDMTDDEIKELLEDVDVKVKKSDDLVMVLAKAIADGKIQPEEEDEDSDDESKDETEESNDSDEDVEKVDENTHFDTFDSEGVNNPENMTEDRNKACVSFQKKFLEDYNNEKITLDDVKKKLDDLLTADELSDMESAGAGEDEYVEAYIEQMKKHIDDEGEMHEGGDAYVINDEYFCCGHKLKEVDGKYVCEVCGSEYGSDE